MDEWSWVDKCVVLVLIIGFVGILGEFWDKVLGHETSTDTIESRGRC